MSTTNNNSFEQTLEHYIVLEKKKNRKQIVFWCLGTLIFFIPFVMNLILWRGTENFWTMFFGLGIVSAFSIWITIDTYIKSNPKIPAKQSPIYDYLVTNGGAVTDIKETLILGSDGRARMIFNLPREHTLVSEATRLELLNKYKTFHPANSTFYFKSSNNKSKQIIIPGNEAPIFAKMLHERMPQAKFGYEPKNNNVNITK